MLLARRPAAPLPAACCNSSGGGGGGVRCRVLVPAAELLAASRDSAAARRPVVAMAAVVGSVQGGGMRLVRPRHPSSSSSSCCCSKASSSSSSSRARGAWSLSWEQELTAQIRACSCVAELREVVLQHHNGMTAGDAAAAIHTLAQVQPDGIERQAARQLACLLEALMFRDGIEQCDAEQLAQAAWACSRLRGLVSAALPAACMDALMRLRKRISAQHLSMVLHGAAMSGGRLPPRQAQALVWALQRPTRLPSATPQAIANSMWAAATMELQVPEEQVQRLVAALAAKASQASPKAVATTLSAVAAMQQQLPAQHVEQLVGGLVAKVEQAAPQHVAATLRAVVTLQQQLPAKQVEQLVAGMVAKLQQVEPHHVSNMLWAVVKMQQQLPAGQVQQLVADLVDKLQRADPQTVATMLWAAAKLEQQLPAQHVEQLVAGLLAQKAGPQTISLTLWAAAAMHCYLPARQVQQLVAGLVAQLQQADQKAVSNTLWACAQLSYLPVQLLAALEAEQQQLQRMVTAMDPQALANSAWACGQLGATTSTVLVGAMLQQAVRRLEHGGGSSFSTQHLCKLAWAASVLDMQSHAEQVHVLARACSQHWGQTAAANVPQLYQVHLWLLDGKLAGGRGLRGPLTQGQLQQCREAWDAGTADTTMSLLHADVLATLRCLPHAWRKRPKAEKRARPDGALSIDVTAVTAGGELLAVEVDGPSHFRRPDGGLTGPTLTATVRWWRAATAWSACRTASGRGWAGTSRHSSATWSGCCLAKSGGDAREVDLAAATAG